MKITQFQVLLFGITLFMMASCKSETATKINKEMQETAKEKPMVLDKLIGTWQNENGREFECWTQKGDDHYQSVVYSLQGKDTLFHEHADVYLEKGKWIFENVVQGQNEGKKTQFTAVILNENTIQFSNPKHDFPTDIHYTLPDKNTVHAFITGKNEQGKTDTIPFNYTRIL